LKSKEVSCAPSFEKNNHSFISVCFDNFNRFGIESEKRIRAMKYQLQTTVQLRRAACRTIILIFLLALVSGLAAAQNTKLATVRIKDGTWAGTTSQGDEISFKVKDYQVVGLILPMNLSCGEFKASGSWEASEAAKLNIKISRTTGVFRIRSLKVGVPGSPELSPTFNVQGRFRTDGSSSGTLQISSSVCSHPVKLTWKAAYKE
jgi:hypothetical protein